MKTVRGIFLFLWVMTLSACVYDAPVVGPDCPELSLILEFPGSPVTKGNEGLVPGSGNENVINDLGIWVFKSEANADGTHDLIASRVFGPYDANDPRADILPQAGTGSSVIKRYVFPIARQWAHNTPLVDVFVMANSASIGMTLDEKASYADLAGASFGDDVDANNGNAPVYQQFSPGNPVHSVDEKGLPMSGFAKGVKVSGEDYSLSIGQLTLKRAVSKLRYVFCQMLTEGTGAETMEVTRIELDGGMIPRQQYVFSESGAHVVGAGQSSSYVAMTMETSPEAPATSFTVPASPTPELYLYGSLSSPASYEQFITEAIAEGKLANPGGTYYLRETDKKLSGKVYYTVNGVERTPVSFEMDTPGDFARNRFWTMYGMFITNRTLLLSLSVQPWDMNEYVIDFINSSATVTIPPTVLPSSVAQLTDPDSKDNVYVTLFEDGYKDGHPAQLYFNIVTPRGWEIGVSPVGESEVTPWFDISWTPSSVTSSPEIDHGRVVVTVAYKRGFPKSLVGKSIELDFKVTSPNEYEPDEISLSSEVNLHYHFVLPNVSDE